MKNEEKAMKRKIVLDTETTGLKIEDGNRIVEIGAVELIDDVKTDKKYHVYINPERGCEIGAFKVHGLTDDFLKEKPRFSEIIDGFLAFIKDAELVIHNADFDIKFLNKELDLANKGKIWDYIKNVECTLKKDRLLYPDERKHSLDAICLRYGVDNQNRQLHGALLDSELLAECYIIRNKQFSPEEIEADLEQINWVRPPIKRYNVKLELIKLSNDEEAIHNTFLEHLADNEKIVPIFNQVTTVKPTM